MKLSVWCSDWCDSEECVPALFSFSTIYRNKEGVSCRDGAEVNVVSTTFTEHVTGVHCSGDSSLLSLDNCNVEWRNSWSSVHAFLTAHENSETDSRWYCWCPWRDGGFHSLETMPCDQPHWPPGLSCLWRVPDSGLPVAVIELCTNFLVTHFWPCRWNSQRTAS